MVEELLAGIARALDGAGIPYMVIGGQAVLVHGEPRLTKDVDVTLGVPPERLEAVLAASAAAGLRPLVDPAPFVRETLVLPCEHPASALRVDLIFGVTAYEQQALGRAVLVPMGDIRVRFATAEDLVIHKVVAGRPRDLEDVRSVLLKNPALDRVLVRRWLGDLGRPLDEDYVSRFDSITAEVGPGR